MKQIITAILVIVSTISLVVVAFTINQAEREKQRLKTDLQYRSTLLAEDLKKTIEPNFINRSEQYFKTIVERFETKERFEGVIVYDNKGSIVAESPSLPKDILVPQKIAGDAMDADKATEDFIKSTDKQVYLLAVPIHDDKSIVGALIIIQNAGYIDDRVNEIWKNNFIRLIVQISLLSVAALILTKWIIYEPIRALVEMLKSARMGKADKNLRLTSSLFFRPLVKEITSIRNSLLEARTSASEEARLRLEKIESPWTAQRLNEFAKDILKEKTIFVVSNREPYVHTKNGGKIDYHFPASGMITAIEPVIQACGGMWIAHGSGNADALVVDKNDKINVPPDDPKYALRRVWLTEKEEAGYYYGFSNEGLWPLCHIAHTRPVFRKEDWVEYKKVNGKFAHTVISEIKDVQKPIILIQDFHLALLPRMIKKSRPDAIVGIFWHIPWPNPESYSINPWKKEVLDGLLGADLIGFHTQLHCNNFIETVGRELESLIDFERFSVKRDNHISYIKPFPISIAFPNGYDGLKNKLDNFAEKDLLKKLGIHTKYIGLGVDRLDYTKGILERLRAVEIFLRKYPSYKENFTFIQVAAPSRSKIEKYRELSQDVEEIVERINALYATKNWKPIIFVKRHHNREEIYQLYRLANICLVTSLHDGMNLVAKEFVSARDDEQGVLILSLFTGASRELKEALIINPYSSEQIADAIKEALEMRMSEQVRRMHGMRETIKDHNVYRWSAELLKTIIDL